MAIFQNSTSPSLSSSVFTKSASPTDTPPDVMTTSAHPAALANARSTASGASGITPMSIASQLRLASIP